MANLCAVVQQLKKERAGAQGVVKRLDAALRALKHLSGGTLSRAHVESCQQRPAGRSLLPKGQGGRR